MLFAHARRMCCLLAALAAVGEQHVDEFGVLFAEEVDAGEWPPEGEQCPEHVAAACQGLFRAASAPWPEGQPLVCN